MSMAAFFINSSEDATRKNLLQLPILEIGGGFSTSDKVEGINPLHGSSNEDFSEKIEEILPSAPADLYARDYSEETVLSGSPNPETVASALEEADVLPTVVAEIVTTDGQAIQVKRRRSKRSMALWTIAISATVLGITVLVLRLKAELQQNQQLQLELSAKDEELQKVIAIYRMERSSGL
ncbi:hypothetical protein GOP47_0023294 [Adiantum capillus-veneris]|uniref:Uncharacterized protein n=1 Tax=Adiantum capillus-veneris TaxID=13818 RepID=A0A9D4Z6D6_ADICA|nr:hypothetical protein GOP47_0023294 [Adiantum capillus-veneris]